MTGSNVLLREFGSCTLDLTSADYTEIRTRYSGKIDVTATERGDIYKVAARDYVGHIALLDGRTLIIMPKLEVTNLFYMLCIEAGGVSFYPQIIKLGEHTDIYSVILSEVVRETEVLVAKGLYSNYLDREADLPVIRGKVELAAQISRYGGLKHSHICHFAEATLNTKENRIVASTLRLATPLLGRTGETGLFNRARALLQHFDAVTPLTRGAAIGMFAKLQKHRLNRAYWPLLGLCKLLLRGLSLSDSSGPHRFASFLIDMPLLFESFVTARLKTLLPRYGLRVVAQRHDYLDIAKQVRIRPDILVYNSDGAIPLLVLDAKYRQPETQHSGLNRDLYQVGAYLHRYGLRRGVLVYPQWDAPGPGSVMLLGTPRELHIAHLDLSAPDPAALNDECAKLAEQVAILSL